ncbi:MAG: hypothetical protein IPG83_02470 [Novosphingobium sp.]|nr:hypothetical protein [Novosphingobium sp.]
MQPVLTFEGFNGDFVAPIGPGDARLAFNMAVARNTWPDIDTYAWAGAPITIYAEEPGTAWPWTTRFIGKVASFGRDRQVLTLGARVDIEPFQKDVLTQVYGGGGGAEGGADIKNKPKPLALGWAMNVEPVPVDATNSVYQFSAYGAIEAVTTLYERGSDFGASVGDYADYTALVAASIPPGRWGTCLASGMVRLGAPAYGVITGDIKGHKVGATTPRLTGAIINALATISGVSSGDIETSTLTTLDSDVPYNINLVLADQITFLDIARRLALPCNYQAGISLGGKLFVTKPSFSISETLTLDTRGRALPLVTDSKQVEVSPPYYRTVMGANRAWRVHSADEIAYAVVPNPRGDYASGTTYREGDIVTSPDGSTWIYIATTAGSGNAPPSWPTTSNAYWDNMTGPSDVAYTAYLTNESATVSADSSGTVSSFTPASGSMILLEAGDPVASGVTYSVATSSNLTISINSSTGSYTVSAMAADTGTATLRATYSGKTFDKVYTLSKVRAGATGATGSAGASGADAKTLTLISDRQTIFYDAAGSASPSTQTTTFTTNKQNTTATVNWSITDAAGVARTPVTSYLSASTGNSVTMTEAQFASARNSTSGVIITASLTDGTTITDKISVVRVSTGATGSAGSNGTNGTNGLNNATVYLYQRAASSPSAPSGTFTYTFATSVLSGGTPGSWTQAVPANDGNPLWVIAAVASANTATDSIAAAEFSSPVIDSGAGLNQAVVRLYQRAASAPSVPGTTLTYTFSTGGLSGTLGSWTTSVPAGSNPIYVTQAVAISASATDTIATGEWSSPVVMAQDGATGAAGSAGTAALSIVVTKKSVSLPAYANGDVTDFGPAVGQLTVYLGSTDVTASATLSATASGCTGTINTATNTPVGSQPKGYYQVTAMSADTATLTITATYSGQTLTEVFSLVKVKGGYEIVATLPATNLFEGRQVYLTTDDKLYRYTGSSWVSTVAAVDITGTITTTQITDGAISTPKLAANAVTANELAADAVTANKILAGAVTTNKLDAGAVTAAKLATTELITLSAQIGGRGDGVITNAKIGNLEVDSAKIANLTVGTNKITDNAITQSVSAFTATMTPILGISYGAIQSCTITAEAGDVIDVVATFNADFISGSNTVLNFRIVRGGTTIYQAYSWTPQYICPAFVDVPGAGTHTYELQAANAGLSCEIDVSNRYMRLLRARK